MTGQSKIEWTDQTWNPIVGCSIVSPGCTNCYAMRQAWRFKASYLGRKVAGPVAENVVRKVNGNAVWTGQLAMAPDYAFFAPLHRKKPTKYFVNSMGDLFHEDCPDEWIDRVFAVIALAPQHTFQVLTKRAKRMREYLCGDWAHRSYGIAKALPGFALGKINIVSGSLPNVWLGVSAERQPEADERIPELLATPAMVRFVSIEPLLGPIRLDRVEEDVDAFADCGGHPDPHWPLDTQDATWLNALRGVMEAEARSPAGEKLGDIDVGLKHEGGKLDWVIVGGESGREARPMHPDWARALRDQCAAAKVAFFFKQWGEWAPQIGAVDGWTIADNPEISRLDHREWEDGRWSDVFRPMWCDFQDGNYDEAQTVSRIGKKGAGRKLDGVEHNEFPRVPA